MKITHNVYRGNVAPKYNYRTYEVTGDIESVISRLNDYLIRSGFEQTQNKGSGLHFRYPSLRFTSTKPLTCISRLSVDIGEKRGKKVIRTGVTFTKIRYFTIIVMMFFCVVLPMIVGYYQRGYPEIPPISLIGIPLGFLVHYHVRARVFKTLSRIISNIE